MCGEWRRNFLSMATQPPWTPSKMVISIPLVLRGFLAANVAGMIFAMSAAGLEVSFPYGAFCLLVAVVSAA
jgi:hypothetical protein